MKKKIVITAPTSVVARNFINYIGDEYDVITLGRRNSDISYDFSSRESLVLPEGVLSIINFAGVLRDDTDDDILNMIDVNVRGVLTICIAAKKYNVDQVINISSVNATLSTDSRYYGNYSLTKKQGEEISELYCKKNGIKLCNIRPSQIFGCDKDYSKVQPLLYSIFHNAAAGNDIYFFGKNDAVRNYTYSDNLFRLIQKAIEIRASGIVNAFNSKNFNLSTVAQMAINSSNSESKIKFLSDKTDIEDNPFFSEHDFYKEWGIEYIEFECAVRDVMRALYVR